MLYLLSCRLCVLLPLLAVQIPIVLTDVTWDSPTAGDVYGPGDTLQAVWTSSDRVVSPSFTICTGADSNSTDANTNPDCGTAVWPLIKQNDTESSISFAIPNITGDGIYHLVMKDDTGTTYDTPSFSLAPANDAVSSDVNSTTTSSTPQQTRTTITYVPSPSGAAAAAIAVPLSLVAAILLGAFLMLLFRGRRARQRERDRETRIQEARDAETKSREKNLSFASATDLERAVWALSANRGYYGEAAPFAHEQPPAGVGGAFAGPGLSAAAAAILGMTAFRWSHGAEPAAPSPYTTDAYTPAPLRRYATASSGHPSYSTHTTGSSHSDHTYVEQDKSRRVVNWLKTDWRGTERMFAEEPTASRVSTPPQLPAIQVHASLPLSRPEVPPPVPPKQLVPGGLDIHAPRAYTPLYESSASVLELRLPSPSGAETHSSLNVISDYMEPSPAPPQSHHLHQSNTHDTELSLPRAPPRSMTRAQTLRRLETLQTREENEKPLPTPPEGGVSALYNAVSRAVAG